MKGKLIFGAAVGSAVIAAVAGGRRVQAWWRTWGIDPAETAAALPGDDIVPDPSTVDTRGITIDAAPEAVWPWLVQMGYGRAGWYSWDRMDMKGSSSHAILPAHQALAVGDTVPTDPGGGFRVATLEPAEALVLRVDPEILAARRPAAPEDAVPAGLAASGRMLESTVPPDFSASWAFVLRRLPDGRTRLLERFRARVSSGSAMPRFAGPLLSFGVFMMTQKQMTGIKERVEGGAATDAAMTYAS